ncbi:hypothetical protein FSPOR_861 [Fusarium sporotrichioides]|uniref:Uncharacterized protein n=1 Tax=Fusarium sporotrichioides TaxID=5514 RepID=A0A395ST06_FUSSP|nr:hypothetical protein FSPOR_861 [Fusarium sporotrichioides]
MNLNFTLPVRSRTLTLPIEAANCSYDNQTISSPPKSDLKVKKRSPFHEKAQPDELSIEQITGRPPSRVVSDQISLLQMVKENIRHLRSQTPSPEPVLKPEPKHKSGQEGARSTSSSYPEDVTRTPDLPSPPDSHMALSNLGDLTRYSRTNDRLSGLRSSSSSFGSSRLVSHGSTYKTLTDAATAAGKLQRLPTPSYHRFEVLSSSEDLALNTIAPHNSEASHESEIPTEGSIGSLETRPLERVAAHTRFDNLADRFYSESPSPSVKLPQIIKSTKRKASSISLQSISAGVKRSRLEVKKLANNVYRSSWDKLRQARENVRRQHKDQKKQYSIWKELRRRLKPGDAIKGKHKKGFVTFSMEKSMRGPKTWWKAGVEKYQAPEWMHFGK